MTCPDRDNLSVRQVMCLIYECLIAEHRAARLDLDARRNFTKTGEDIEESRALVEEAFADPDPVEESESSMTSAALDGLIEWG